MMPVATPEALVVDRVASALAGARAHSMRVAFAGAAAEIVAHEDVAPFLLAPFAHLQPDRQRPAGCRDGVPRRHPGWAGEARIVRGPRGETPPGQPAGRRRSEGLPSDVDLRIEVAPLRESDARELALDGVADTGAIVSADGTVVHLHAHSVSVLDRRANRIHALVRTAGGVAPWHRAKPLQVPLSIFFADRGVDFVHGGLVSLRGTGVLVAGMGGSGKSTLTLASLLEGLDLLGDDCVAVRGLEGYSIYGTASVEPEHLRRFPLLASADAGGKTVLPLAELFPERMAAATHLRAIVLPRVTHGEHVTVHPASGKEALLALAPSSILKRAVPAAAALARMTRLVRELPAYRLEMGPVAEIGPRMRALLEELGS